MPAWLTVAIRLAISRRGRASRVGSASFMTWLAAPAEERQRFPGLVGAGGDFDIVAIRFSACSARTSRSHPTQESFMPETARRGSSSSPRRSWRSRCCGGNSRVPPGGIRRRSRRVVPGEPLVALVRRFRERPHLPGPHRAAHPAEVDQGLCPPRSTPGDDDRARLERRDPAPAAEPREAKPEALAAPALAKPLRIGDDGLNLTRLGRRRAMRSRRRPFDAWPAY